MTSDDPNPGTTNGSPGLPSIIEALRNIKNGRLFVCLEATESPGKVRVINPNGDVLVVKEELFELEPLEIPASQFNEHFTGEQLQAFKQWLVEQAERAIEEQRRAEAEKHQAAQEPTRRIATSSTPARTRPPGQRREPKNVVISNYRGRVAAQWNCERLTFYRHKIDPLALTDQFIVRVDGEGEYQMTKAEFQRVFNNVVMSSSYRSTGLFSYNETPPEAARFLKR